ncbi:hypothetical protein BH10ACI3_BH10ACI3_08690 [soil metagenome]
MKEAVFILFVVFLLLGLTAIRYRKTIAGLIGMARMLKDAKDSVGQASRSFPGEPAKSIPLVNCSKCGVWVPENKARKLGDLFYCSDECVKQSTAR